MLRSSEDDPAVMSMEDFVETDLLLTLDSGCCDHDVDMADAPGYICLRPSPIGWIAARAEVRGRQWRPSQQQRADQTADEVQGGARPLDE